MAPAGAPGGDPCPQSCSGGGDRSRETPFHKHVTGGAGVDIGAALVDYIGGLTLSGGDRDGEEFSVLPWERRFIRGAFATTGHAALSVARGNGKSALVAGIAAAVVDPDGPLHGNRREAVAVASSFDQGRTIFEDVLGFLRGRHDIGARKTWRLQDSANRATIEHRASGARVRCIGSDPTKAHGLRPALVLADEPAQWDSAKADRMLAALRTSLGKVPESRLIALGTRPATPTHWFGRMLAGGGAGYVQCHAGGEDDKPLPHVHHAQGESFARPSAEPSGGAQTRGLGGEVGPRPARRVPGAEAEWRGFGCRGR